LEKEIWLSGFLGLNPDGLGSLWLQAYVRKITEIPSQDIRIVLAKNKTRPDTVRHENKPEHGNQDTEFDDTDSVRTEIRSHRMSCSSSRENQPDVTADLSTDIRSLEQGKEEKCAVRLTLMELADAFQSVCFLAEVFFTLFGISEW
jgi:hypothetical protein